MPVAMNPSEEELNYVKGLEDEMVKLLSDLCSIPAIDPGSGGEGEYDKAVLLEKRLKDFGFDDIQRVDIPDEKAKNGVRPNVIATIPGQSKEILWVVTHLDVVPPGELSDWETDPFEPVVKEGKVYARGSEDNGQELVASVFAAKALMDLGLKSRWTIKLCFVSDEETGSDKGIQALIDRDMFSPYDIIIVPDYGIQDSSMVEIGEKSILWLEVNIEGRQTHASMPHRGLNAHRLGSTILRELDTHLHNHFSKEDELFDPPVSTFEPTRKDGNGTSINTVPGDDKFFFDCRVLPDYPLKEVLDFASERVAKNAIAQGGSGSVKTVISKEAPPKTPVDSPCVNLLSSAIRASIGVEPKIMGVGGGTCASWFRQAGLPAVVWGTQENKAHEPNEYARIENMVKDAMVFFTLFKG